MDPGHPSIVLMNENEFTNVKQKPVEQTLETQMDLLESGGTQQRNPAKPKVSRKMDFLG